MAMSEAPKKRLPRQVQSKEVQPHFALRGLEICLQTANNIVFTEAETFCEMSVK